MKYNIDITDKIDQALNRIEYRYSKYGSIGLFTGHSGGKDSTVLLNLAQQINPDIIIVHNVKPMLGPGINEHDHLTEMHPETLEFLYSKVCKENTLHFLHSSNMKRFVSMYGLKCQLDGARASEWNRAGKSSEIIINGEKVNRKDMPEFAEHGMFGLSFCFPIYDWSDDDIFDYISLKNLSISAEYLKNGELDTWNNKRMKENRA